MRGVYWQQRTSAVTMVTRRGHGSEQHTRLNLKRSCCELQTKNRDDTKHTKLIKIKMKDRLTNQNV